MGSALPTCSCTGIVAQLLLREGCWEGHQLPGMLQGSDPSWKGRGWPFHASHLLLQLILPGCCTCPPPQGHLLLLFPPPCNPGRRYSFNLSKGSGRSKTFSDGSHRAVSSQIASRPERPRDPPHPTHAELIPSQADLFTPLPTARGSWGDFLWICPPGHLL